MLIINKDKNNKKDIQINIKHANNFFEKLRGLMFTSKHNFNYALIFHMDNAKIRNGIHMLFVFYPILVLFLDENKCVVDKVILPPFYPLYTPKSECKYIIELPTKYNSQIKLDDFVNWK